MSSWARLSPKSRLKVDRWLIGMDIMIPLALSFALPLKVILVESITLCALALCIVQRRLVGVGRMVVHICMVVDMVLGWRLALLSLAASGLGFFPHTTSLLLLLAQFAVLDLVLSNKGYRRVAKYALVFAKLAYPLVLWPLRVGIVLPRGLLASLSCLNMQVPCCAAPVPPLGSRRLRCFAPQVVVRYRSVVARNARGC